MRKNRLKLIQIVATVVILGLVIFSPLLILQPQQTASNEMNVPPRLAHVAVIDRPRPETRIERMLKLDKFAGFDRDIASLLNGSRQLRSGDDVAAAPVENARASEQIASLSTEHRDWVRLDEANDVRAATR